jgi:hypothetical protein
MGAGGEFRMMERSKIREIKNSLFLNPLISSY